MIPIGDMPSDFENALGAVVLGVLGGIAVAAILSALTGAKCPVCNNQLIRGVRECPHCHAPLRWD